MSPTSLTDLKAPTVLRNRNCVYCGVNLAVTGSTKEHVIGRRFVPKGVLNGSWNLIVNACPACNGRKSGFENDIAALTMQGHATGKRYHDDPRLEADASRKAVRSISRTTGRPVGESVVTDEFSFALARGTSATFRIVAPPQLDRDRVLQLANYHVTAFFFFLTYDRGSERGSFCEGEFVQMDFSPRHDWGSAKNRGFMDLTGTWEPRLVGFTADGFFKICIRKHSEVPVWSWALEWNRGYRVIGFMGEPVSLSEIEARVSRDSLRELPCTDGSLLRWREEVPLVRADDRLFGAPAA